MMKPTEGWYQLSQEEQNSLLDKVAQTLEKIGGKQIVVCDSSWASEQWPFFGVEEFPNIEAVQKHAQLLNELDWPSRYGMSITLLGTEWQPS
jgi:hypothetical protein